MGKRRVKLSNQIRQAVVACGVTRYSISKATGISESALSRFVSGERGLSLGTLDRLADFLELSIVAGKRPKPKGR